MYTKNPLRVPSDCRDPSPPKRHLDKIAEILADVEFADDTAIKLHDLMSDFEFTRTHQVLMRTPGFAKLWDGLAEAVDRSGGFDGRYS